MSSPGHATWAVTVVGLVVQAVTLVVAGGGLVILGALFPATWRWVRRPPLADAAAVAVVSG